MIISFKFLLRLYDSYWGFEKKNPKQGRFISIAKASANEADYFFKFTKFVYKNLQVKTMFSILMNRWIVCTSEVQIMKCIIVG